MEIVIKEKEWKKEGTSKVETQELLKGLLGIAANADEKTLTLSSTSRTINLIKEVLNTSKNIKTLNFSNKEIYIAKGIYIELKEIESYE